MSLQQDDPELDDLDLLLAGPPRDEWWETVTAGLSSTGGRGKLKEKYEFFELSREERRELMSFRNPTKEDELALSVPFPEGAYPKKGLPCWKNLFLDKRLPMLKAPKNSVVFARGKLGTSLWRTAGAAEFILYDPYGYEVTFPYDNVHDGNLSFYYEGEAIREFLRNLGDIDEEGNAFCTLKKFNTYRRYLRTLHLAEVHKVIERQEAIAIERYSLDRIRAITKKKMEKLALNALIQDALKAANEEIRREREARKKRLIQNVKDKEIRFIKLMEQRRLKQIELKIKGEENDAKMLLKNQIAQEIERRRKIATLRKWHDDEERREARLKVERIAKAKEKAAKESRRWYNKIYAQKKSMAFQKELLRVKKEIRETNIEVRKSMAMDNKKREEDTFRKIRQADLKKRTDLKKSRKLGEMIKLIRKHWFKSREELDVRVENYRVNKCFNSAVAQLNGLPMEGPDPLSIILQTRDRLEKEALVPLQVSVATEFILESSIKRYISKRVETLFDELTEKAVNHGDRKIDEIATRYKYRDPMDDLISHSVNESQGSAVGSSRQGDESVEEKQAEQPEEIKHEPPPELEPILDERRETLSITHVTFGEVIEHEPGDDVELPTDLKQVRYRRPTPVPSVTTLTYCGFKEKELADILPNTDSENALTEKAKYKDTFRQVAKFLLKLANVYADRVYEPKTRAMTLGKLSNLGDYTHEDVIRTLTNVVADVQECNYERDENFIWCSKVLARNAVQKVLRPPEFDKKFNEAVTRTRIMRVKSKILEIL